MAERLDAFLSRSGAGTRSEVKRLVRAGRVTVGGAVCRDPARHVGVDAVLVDGRAIERRPAGLHVVLHKPAGHACTHDRREEPIVYDLLPPEWRGMPLEAAGRLDRDASGLLVLSTDGELLHRLTGPRRHVPKRYRVAYAGRLAADAPARFARGLALADEHGPTLPAELAVDEAVAGGGRATVVLHEGRYHQVKRMFAACGARVTALHRDRIGAFDLPSDLPPGGVRELTPDQLALLLG